MTNLQILLKLDRMRRRLSHERKQVDDAGNPKPEVNKVNTVRDIAAILPL